MVCFHAREDVKIRQIGIVMNGWLVAAIVYGIGFVLTVGLVIWEMRGTEESYNNEPGEDGAAMFILLVIWPVTWGFFINERIHARREKRERRIQR